MLCACVRNCLNIISEPFGIAFGPFDIAFDCIERAASASIRRQRLSLQIPSIAVTPRERSA